MTAKRFLRRSWNRYLKLGKRRKKKRVWRNPSGIDNKMKKKRRGYPSVVSIGYRKNKKLRGKIEEKKPVVIRNTNELEKVGKKDLVILGNIGKKKKIEIVKKARDMKIKIYNLSMKKFLGKIEKHGVEEEKKAESKEEPKLNKVEPQTAINSKQSGDEERKKNESK